MPEVLNLARAERPEFSTRQINLCDELIGMGLAKLAIASIILGVGIESLTPTQVTSVGRLIAKRYKHLGYKITDARHARTEFMAKAVQAAAKRCKIVVHLKVA